MIAKMDRVEVVFMRDLLPEMATFIQSQGVMHMEEVPLVLEDDADYLHRVHLDADQKEEFDLLDSFRRNLLEVRPLLSVQPPHDSVTAATQRLANEPQEGWRALARTISRNLRRLARRRLNIQDNLEVLRNFRRNLESIQPLVSDGSVRLGKNARAFVLRGDVTAALERLDARLREQIGLDVRLISKKMSRSSAVGVITYSEGKGDAVGEVMRAEQIVPVDVPDKEMADTSLSDLVLKVHANIARQEAQLAEIQGEIDEYSRRHGAELLALERIVGDAVARYQVCSNFANSQMVAVIHGWVPSDQVDHFRQSLEVRFPKKVAVDVLPANEVEAARIPTLLKNPPWFKPFEVLLMLFKPPTYGTYDPTALVGVSFIIFYGFILGDAVYGVVLFLLGRWIKNKWAHIEVAHSIGVVAQRMGISSIIFGIIYGEYLGNFVERMWPRTPLVHIIDHMPYLFHRAHETETLLLYGILFGVVHIPLALILGIREKLHHGHTKHAYEQVGMLMGLTAIGIGIFGSYANWPVFNTMPMQVLAVILFIGGSGLILGVMGAVGLVQILEIVSLVGNVLSYARLMALGVASIALADIANAALYGDNWLLGIPVAFVVHLLNIGIGIFSPTLHSLRLNYVEFLPKFYSPEGSNYKPFKKEATW